jgi:leader peptidase (prepilin peptidase)/N-methyltransferase
MYSGGQLLAFSVILGLLVGSFLNVVIYRVPEMLKRQWRSECTLFLELESSEAEKETKPFNLVTPNSTCPKCGHKIKPWENIPVISYLFLRGKCSNCQTPISLRYPAIEALTGALTGFMVYQLGANWDAVFAMLFLWMLIALFFIDYDEQLLPDNITLPLLWLGLIVNSQGMFTDLNSALFGAVFGYLSLWSVYCAFKLATGKEGMGHGDFKLLAAFGAWCGWMMLPQIIIISSLVGLCFGLLQAFRAGESKPFAFGPSLIVAGLIAFLWGNEINTWYLSSL